jgi:hypothetical protein
MGRLHDPTPAAPRTRRIWLCADDYGIAPGVNQAIRELAARGRINATSVMVVAPGFDKAQALALDQARASAPALAIGLHLTLTAPYRPLTGFVPVRQEAFLPLSAMVRAALLRRLDAHTIRREVDAQLAAFATAFGRPPDFVDGHQHVHVLPQVREAVLAAVTEMTPRPWVRQCETARPLRGLWAGPKTMVIGLMSRGLRERARAAGIATNTAFAGVYVFRPGADFSALFPRFLALTPEGGLIMCHPGIVDAALQRLDPLTLLREQEYAFLLSDAFPRILAEHGVTLV